MPKKNEVEKVENRGKKTNRKVILKGKEKNVADLIKKNFAIVDTKEYKKPADKHEPDYVKELVEECIQKCIDNSIMPNMRMLAAYMRIDYTTMYKWIREETTPTAIYLKSVQNTLAGILEQGALSGDINNISAIFLLKSTHGYQEVNEMTLKIENDNGNTAMTKEQIAKRINDDIIDIDVVESE